MIVSDSDTWPLLGRCSSSSSGEMLRGAYRFHPARPTNHIIIAAISGGGSTSSIVAILPLLGRCSISSSKLTLSLLPFGRLPCWGLSWAWLACWGLPCWGLSWAWLACWGSRCWVGGGIRGINTPRWPPPSKEY